MTTMEVAIWIWHHKSGNAFKDWNVGDIVRELQTYDSAVVVDEKGIIGCATGCEVNGKLRIRNILTTKPDGIRQLLKIFKDSKYKDLSIVGKRQKASGDKELSYDPTRLCKHFSC